ncbi:hypothetical protein ROZALSC1DRAFT_25773, partial [Rozella allomycis CSF55]
LGMEKNFSDKVPGVNISPTGDIHAEKSDNIVLGNNIKNVTSENGTEIGPVLDDVPLMEVDELETAMSNLSEADRAIWQVLETFRKSPRTPEDFEVMEVKLFNLTKSNLICECKGILFNHGRGGDPNQFGARLIQVGCKNCKKRTRFVPILNANHKEKLATQNKETPSLTQKKINFVAKKRAIEEPEEVIQQDKEVIPTENDSRIKELEKENAELKALLKSQSAQIAQLIEEVKKLNEKVAPQTNETSPSIQPAKVPEVIATAPAKIETENEKPARTFASIAKKNSTPRKILKKTIRAAQTLGKPRGPPAEFLRYHIVLHNSRAVRQHRIDKKLGSLSRRFFKENNLTPFVAQSSFVGNSILEVYIVAHE